jgi:hypothetical protein
MSNKIIKRFDIAVAAANAKVSKSIDLEKTITHIEGLLLTSDKDDLLYYRGSQKIEISKEEIFPETFESKLLMSGVNVAPNKRFYELDHVANGNGNVKIEYQDKDDSRADFEAYRISLYLLCETN